MRHTRYALHKMTFHSSRNGHALAAFEHRHARLILFLLAALLLRNEG
jgi:hypothetical protein